jgi:hypothetical protein
MHAAKANQHEVGMDYASVYAAQIALWRRLFMHLLFFKCSQFSSELSSHVSQI